MDILPVDNIEGRCEVRKKNDVPPISDAPAIFEHIFFCERMYDPHKGSLNQVVVFSNLIVELLI